MPALRNRLALRDYVNGTHGFGALGAATGKPVKSLMRMLGPNGNPQAQNLFEIVAHLQKKEGIRLQARPAARRRGPGRTHVVKRSRARAWNTLRLFGLGHPAVTGFEEALESM